MDMATLTSIVAAVIVASTPLLFAALGELVTERAGVLNLGVEGMMVMGAVVGFSVTYETQSHLLGVISSAAAGAVLALIFGVLTQLLLANQVATGLALTMFGLGASALWGQSYTGLSGKLMGNVDIPVLSEIPVIGPLLFQHDPMVYLCLALLVAVWWFLTRTRKGMILRAVGENHGAAHALGYRVVMVRMAAIMFGGACAGLGGAYLSIVQTPLWADGMTAGRGWIALAIVVFAAWRPWRAMAGAYLFGGVTVLQLHAQAMGIEIESQYMSMLPYLVTIVVLVAISHDPTRARMNAPGSLGKTFFSTS